MSEPEQYIFEEWDSMCAKANKSLRGDCPLLEDETLVEIHKHVGALRIENDKLRKLVAHAENDLNGDYNWELLKQELSIDNDS